MIWLTDSAVCRAAHEVGRRDDADDAPRGVDHRQGLDAVLAEQARPRRSGVPGLTVISWRDMMSLQRMLASLRW